MSQIEKPDCYLQLIANIIRFLCVCMTIAFHDVNNPEEFGALIYQELHLAKLLPVTDALMKMGLLSVNDLLEKRRLRTTWAKNILNDTKKFQKSDIIKYR